jgi:hypothetical protein
VLAAQSWKSGSTGLLRKVCTHIEGRNKMLYDSFTAWLHNGLFETSTHQQLWCQMVCSSGQGQRGVLGTGVARHKAGDSLAKMQRKGMAEALSSPQPRVSWPRRDETLQTLCAFKCHARQIVPESPDSLAPAGHQLLHMDLM